MSGLSRRAFLLIASLLAPVARLRAGARQRPTPGAGLAPVSEQEFLRLSQRLVGRTTLDAQVAATYRQTSRCSQISPAAPHPIRALRRSASLWSGRSSSGGTQAGTPSGANLVSRRTRGR